MRRVGLAVVAALATFAVAAPSARAVGPYPDLGSCSVFPDPRHLRQHPRRLGPPRLALRRGHREPRRADDGDAAAAEGGYGLGGFSGPARTIALALKRYGAIVADNGSNWYLGGSSDRRWDDQSLD